MSDFTALFSSNPETLMSGGATNMFSGMNYTPIGLPADPVSELPPAGLESSMAADIPPPVISSLGQRIWDTVKSDSNSAISAVESGVKNVYGGFKDITKTVYGDVSSGVGTVFDDVSKPVTGFLTGSYWYMIMAVVVLGGVIYFAGKSGALRISR